MMKIAPQYLTLHQLLTNQLFRIPQYQRSYSWGTRQRRDLFEDIRLSYAPENSTDHFMATVVALARDRVRIAGIASEHLRVDIVDGQQRITTLILLLKAITKSLDTSESTQKNLCDEIEKMLVKPDAIELLLQTNQDSSDHFANYIRTGYFANASSAKTLADRQLLTAMKDCEDFVKDWQNEGLSLENLVGHLFNRLTFIYHQIDDEGLVYTVFEVLNSRGLQVSWFDRLKSMLMAIVFESKETDARDENIVKVHQLWSDIYRTIGLRIGLSTESLRFAATLYRGSAPSRPLGEEESVDLLHKGASAGPGAVIDVSRWIKSVTEAVDKVRENRRLNAVTDIQQARLVATAVNLRTDIGAAEKERILRRWENVSFRIYGMNAKDARTAVGDYTRLAWNIGKGGYSVNQILEELARIGQRYPIDKAVKELRQTNCYEKLAGEELKYFFHRYEEHLTRKAGANFENRHWDHIWSRDSAESIEHILPQSEGSEHVHWLGNLLLLPPPLNSKLGKMAPKNKTDAYRETGMRIALEAAQQVENGWNREAIQAREEELLVWAKQEWAD